MFNSITHLMYLLNINVEWWINHRPRTKNYPSPLILGPGGHTSFWYDVNIQQRMKLVLLFVIVLFYCINGVTCSTALHTLCTVEYKWRLINASHPWIQDHDWRVSPGPRTRSDQPWSYVESRPPLWHDAVVEYRMQQRKLIVIILFYCINCVTSSTALHAFCIIECKCNPINTGHSLS